MDIKKFIEQCKRVIMVSSKPDKDEFEQTAKVVALGMAVIGLLGFIIFIVIQLIGGI